MIENSFRLSLLALAAGALPANAALYSYYVGTDNAPVFTSGTYSGQPNPNYNRLTFLLGHTYPDNPAINHFHRLGAYALTGSAASPSVFYTNPRVPEGNVPPCRFSPAPAFLQAN